LNLSSENPVSCLCFQLQLVPLQLGRKANKEDEGAESTPGLVTIPGNAAAVDISTAGLEMVASLVRLASRI
jgi:hypothetical protein